MPLPQPLSLSLSKRSIIGTLPSGLIPQMTPLLLLSLPPISLLLTAHTAGRASRAINAHHHRASDIVLADFVADAAAGVRPSIARIVGATPDGQGQEALGGAVAVDVGSEILLLTSTNAICGRAGANFSLADDDYAACHQAEVTGELPELDLVLLSLPEGVPVPPVATFGNSTRLAEGDFVIACGDPTGDRAGASLGLLCSRSGFAMPSRSASGDGDAFTLMAPPPGTAEAAMAEAEAEAEAEATARGEQPFLVIDAPSVGGMSGGPLLNDAGEVVGVNTHIISAGDAATRVYAVSAERLRRALDAFGERRRLEQRMVPGARVVLRNDPFNKRAMVQRVLSESGLSAEAASIAMLGAHNTGRGVIGVFTAREEAEDLANMIAVVGSRYELPAPLLIEVEPCKVYQPEPPTADDVASAAEGEAASENETPDEPPSSVKSGLNWGFEF